MNEAGLEWLHLPQSAEEREFLRGSREHSEELASAGRIFLEFVRGFAVLDLKQPCVTIFGSARFTDGHPYYDLARHLGRQLAEAGYAVITGGGPGIMEAANRGAREGNGLSIGCNIQLPREQKRNCYLDRFVEFEHFFVRKVMLLKYSQAFVVLPGGLGTLDEVFETATLMQTGKIESFPIVALGGEFWQSMRDFINGTLVTAGTIDVEDLKLITLASSVEQAVQVIQTYAARVK